MQKITVEKRSGDYMAFADGDRGVWEAGRNEWEAAGKLVLRLQGESECDQPQASAQPDEMRAAQLEQFVSDCAHLSVGKTPPGVLLEFITSEARVLLQGGSTIPIYYCVNFWNQSNQETFAIVPANDPDDAWAKIGNDEGGQYAAGQLIGVRLATVDEIAAAKK